MKILVSLIVFAGLAAAQGTDAALTGNVLDATGANVPGASVTALNTKTGVSTVALANGSGVYLFAALPPGDYRVTAEKSGFRKLVLNDQTLHTGDHVNLNLSLEIGATSESVEVTANSDAVNTLTSSTGGVVNAQKITDLPVTSRNAMDLVLTQAGLVSTGNGVNINGARTDMVNITLDGVNIIDNFINESLTNVMIFPSVDRIDEVKVVTSPADAEYGRGSGQVQLISRSGTNQFHGSLYDYARNADLNANSWSNNRNSLARPALVFNDSVGRLAGPIKKNKTFFFGLFESQISRSKSTVTSTTLTDTARQGIYRFFPGVTNGNANANNPVVDLNGNPVTPRGATGTLQSVSLFGLDPNRLVADPTGIVAKNLALLPKPNSYLSGDGLNTAGFIWRRQAPDDIYSVDVRLDHNFSDTERLTLSYNRDSENALNGFAAQPLPTSPAGNYQDHATVGSVALTSTLRSNIINVATVGVQRNNIQFLAPWTASSQGQGILPTLGGVPYILGLAIGTSPLSTSANTDPQGRISPVYQFSDKAVFSKGAHQMKVGLERRYVSANEFVSFNAVPRVTLGAASNIPTQNITTIAGIGANATTAGTLLTTLAGSVASETQTAYSPGGSNPIFLPGQQSQHTWRSGEWSTYFQDDIKVKRNLTVNLGVRWDYYGVPYEAGGRIDGLVGGSQSLFGLSGTNLGALFHPGVMPGSLTQLALIGKNSPNPQQQVYGPSYHNFAPAVGLAWALPWLGADKTVVRAGYGIAYERNPLVLMSQIYGNNQPGLSQAVTLAPTNYLSLGNASLPLQPVGLPLSLVPVNDNNGSPLTVTAIDSNLRTPYTQNWNVSIGREISPGFNIDVRYVGSKGTRLVRGTNINEVNIFENGILQAFQTTTAGGNSPLLDQIFNGLNVSGAGVVNGSTITGSDAVRKNVTMQGYLINNDVGGFANYLATTTNYTGVRGGLLKNGNLPANFVMANPQFGAADLISNFGNSIYHSAQIEATKRFAYGFTFQGSYVRSKALGDYDGNQQSQISSFVTLRDERQDRRLLSFDVPNVIRTSGIWDLPFGPGRKMLRNSHGIVGRVVEKWQTAVIFNKLSGTPQAFTAGTPTGISTSYLPSDTFNTRTATPFALGPIPMDLIQVQKSGNNVIGLAGLTAVADPSIQNLPANLRSLSALTAIQGPNGQILLQNPALGTLGNLNQTNLRGLGSFTLNMQVSKTITLRQDSNLGLILRADATNLLNKPIWANPTLNINSTSFGQITSATGGRIIGVSARIEF